MISDKDFTARGRPKSLEKAEAIREAAGDLFLKHGFERTSMDAIASRAGVSKQTVYSHFSNKDELFRACILGKVADYNLADTDALRDLPVHEGIAIIGRNYLTLRLDPRVIEMHRLVLAESTTNRRIAEDFYQYGPVPTQKAVERFLSHHHEAGRLHVPDPQHSARLLLHMFHSQYEMPLMLGLREPPPEAELSAYIHTVANEFIRICRV